VNDHQDVTQKAAGSNELAAFEFFHVPHSQLVRSSFICIACLALCDVPDSRLYEPNWN
jgi:hypothetical protein